MFSTIKKPYLQIIKKSFKKNANKIICQKRHPKGFKKSEDYSVYAFEGETWNRMKKTNHNACFFVRVSAPCQLQVWQATSAHSRHVDVVSRLETQRKFWPSINWSITALRSTIFSTLRPQASKCCSPGVPWLVRTCGKNVSCDSSRDQNQHNWKGYQARYVPRTGWNSGVLYLFLHMPCTVSKWSPIPVDDACLCALDGPNAQS